MKNLKQKKLGDILTNEGIISAETRDKALNYQSGGKLGQVLLNNGSCNSLTIYKALAKQRDLEFANLLENPPQIDLLSKEHLADYLDLQIVPWQYDPHDDTMLIAAVEFTEAQDNWAKKHYPKYRFVQTAPLDIHRSLSTAFANELSHQSVNKLAIKSPIQSARILINSSQHVPLLILMAVVVTLIIVSPASIVIGFLLLMNLFHLLTLSFKFLLFIVGSIKRDEVWNKHKNIAKLSDLELPTYTILVPLYKEATSLPNLVRSLQNFNYPKHKLDIKLIIEEDDKETLETARKLRPEGTFEILQVPFSKPRTKPKACNYALRFARGEIVTIYDAEDRPHRNQLRDVAHQFANGKDDLVCVQCRLNYYNRDQNILTKLFSIEYAAWFDFMIPALDYLKVPIPLGGTSNHIYRQKLLELGEWDPFNVTEDADLGIRLASFRYRTEVIKSQTLEESPTQFWAWLKQRSRWIKGYMQTWLVYMRRPIWLLNKLGWRGFASFQFFIGGPCIVFLTTPILFTMSLIWLINPPEWQSSMADIILPISLSMLAYGVIIHMLFAIETVRRRKWSNMFNATITFPFYWLLHSIASFRALSQLITRPHYWEKTDHIQDSGNWQNELDNNE